MTPFGLCASAKMEDWSHDANHRSLYSPATRQSFQHCLFSHVDLQRECNIEQQQFGVLHIADTMSDKVNERYRNTNDTRAWHFILVVPCELWTWFMHECCCNRNFKHFLWTCLMPSYKITCVTQLFKHVITQNFPKFERLADPLIDLQALPPFAAKWIIDNPQIHRLWGAYSSCQNTLVNKNSQNNENKMKHLSISCRCMLFSQGFNRVLKVFIEKSVCTSQTV